MDEQDAMSMLSGMLPTPAYIFGAILFGVFGIAAYRYGRKNGRDRVKWLGLALMLYPYVTGSSTWLLYGVGVALCGLIYVFRD